MLEPKTPLPWKPYACFKEDGLTSGIESSDGKMVCEVDDLELVNPGGFEHVEDMRYAVYAANLLPELINRIQIAKSELDPDEIYGSQSIAFSQLFECLDLVENYKP